ncbi:EthD domain protein [Metarhizium robertsii]|uniref:Dimeric alpha-beta barrel n=2 Tax=Metarhizium robertsii TaxID=568076 RepID=E9F7V1_METRA|nr:Dimeric alpha-beta barrel [Metarhizium robertsii ARSEF 23]EFY96239.1 Dimeric alpha-beta barrel [Metarhizium robertsii ARSEF 23]EXU98503.1 EthD domain protein [Metarhizium robertsii]
MAEPVEPIQKRRLLRMTVAHYRQPNVSEEDFHHWVTEKHATQAAKLHAKNGIEGFSIYFAPKSFRNATAELNAKRGSPWVVRDYDAQVEFLFRDMETFYKGASDPDFQALQAEEEPFISGIHAEISIGWIETYVSEGRVVNVGDDGKPMYPTFKESNVAP